MERHGGKYQRRPLTQPSLLAACKADGAFDERSEEEEHSEPPPVMEICAYHGEEEPGEEDIPTVPADAAETTGSQTTYPTYQTHGNDGHPDEASQETQNASGNQNADIADLEALFGPSAVAHRDCQVQIVCNQASEMAAVSWCAICHAEACNWCTTRGSASMRAPYICFRCLYTQISGPAAARVLVERTRRFANSNQEATDLMMRIATEDAASDIFRQQLEEARLRSIQTASGDDESLHDDRPEHDPTASSSTD